MQEDFRSDRREYRGNTRATARGPLPGIDRTSPTGKGIRNECPPATKRDVTKGRGWEGGQRGGPPRLTDPRGTPDVSNRNESGSVRGALGPPDRPASIIWASRRAGEDDDCCACPPGDERGTTGCSIGATGERRLPRSTAADKLSKVTYVFERLKASRGC